VAKLSRPLSIAHLSHLAAAGAPTGAENSLLLLARGLDRLGHTVRAIQPAEGALADAWKQSGISTEVIPCRQCWLAYWEEVAPHREAWKWASCLAPNPAVGRIGRQLEAWAPDVVHVNCLTHVAGAQAAADRPVVWHLREILPPGRRRRWFASQLRKHATRIVVVSEAVGRWVREEGLGDRLHVIFNGVDVKTASMPAEEARRALGLTGESSCRIGFLGQLVPHKGPLEFVQAAGLALREEPGLEFFLAGGGPAAFRREIETLITDSPNPGRIHLLPPQPDGKRLVAAADMVCLTTTTPDPFPRSVLEAMGAARPVVGFFSGGASEMVVQEETGRLTESADIEALATSFVELGRDPERRERMGAAGQRRAREEFSAERHVERMERVFLQAAGR
jgi:glycosyltransferase involved in cell wall biosynthesis